MLVTQLSPPGRGTPRSFSSFPDDSDWSKRRTAAFELFANKAGRIKSLFNLAMQARANPKSYLEIRSEPAACNMPRGRLSIHHSNISAKSHMTAFFLLPCEKFLTERF